MSFLVLLELIEVGCLIGPADKEALLEVQSHAFDPFSDTLEAIVVIPNTMAFCFDHFDRDGVAFWVQEDCLPWVVRVVNVELYDEATFDAGRYQLLCLVHEKALLNESHVKR